MKIFQIQTMMIQCRIFGIEFHFNMLNETLFYAFYEIMGTAPFTAQPPEPHPCQQLWLCTCPDRWPTVWTPRQCSAAVSRGPPRASPPGRGTYSVVSKDEIIKKQHGTHRSSVKSHVSGLRGSRCHRRTSNGSVMMISCARKPRKRTWIV